MSPGEGRSDLAVIGIHGLPRTGIKPEEQLASLTQAFALFPGLRDQYTFVEWLKPTYFNVGRARVHLRNGTFGATFMPQVGQVLESTSAKRRVVIGYSVGGAIFYQWLLNQRQPVEGLCGVAIAAPFQCQEGYITFEHDPEQVRHLVGEEPLEPADIAARFESGRLLVLLAENDGTIRRNNAAFSQELVEKYKVIQTTITGATHNTICQKADTLVEILAHFRRCGIEF